MAKKEKKSLHLASAEKILKDKCPTLTLEWTMDSYWGLVTQKYLLGACHAVYDKLLKKGHSEKNKFVWNDCDNTAYFIKTRANKNKVFVTTDQNHNYLYVIGERFGDEEFHVRRFWEEYKPKSDRYTPIKPKYTAKQAIASVRSLKDYSDEYSQFPDRWSLKTYKKVDFTMEFHNEPRMYGDLRDSGYVLSYQGFIAKHGNPRIDGSKMSFGHLDIISNIEIPCLVEELEIENLQTEIKFGHR